ncbi:MAG: hypothetical protein IT443_09175 [Phycisphaeraceae bacterium]|nr:hypothetical protein [Phycisphaeraceae bacterium]
MRSLRYLNAVLTLIALLLTVHLWTLWTLSPVDLSLAQTARAEGIPDSGAQRNEMIAELKSLNQRMDSLIGLLRSGEVRVRLEESSAEAALGRPGTPVAPAATPPVDVAPTATPTTPAREAKNIITTTKPDAKP